jgi:hypothetical protein
MAAYVAEEFILKSLAVEGRISIVLGGQALDVSRDTPFVEARV